MDAQPETAAPARPTCPDVADLVALGRAGGLDAVGVAPAGRFESTFVDLQDRKAAGLHGGMNFTYRKPERSTDPDHALPGAQALVVGARSYLEPDPPHGTRARPQGRVARYAWRDHYAALRKGLTGIADELRRQGWKARVVADDNALVDREAARRAGLGWYGKNANLLLPGTGSWFVLGSVVTDAPLPVTAEDDRPGDGCGTCTRCLDGCPTGAIVAPGVVDARRCLAWLLQATGPFPRAHRVALGDRMYGCDDCQEVCPPNRRTQRRQASHPATGEPEPEVWVDLLELFELDDAAALERYGRWYIPRREARYLRRNALVVLGNVADPDDERVVTVLSRSLADDDPIVRSHAVWAARRLGRPDLVTETPGLADDPDPLVQEELGSREPNRGRGIFAARPGTARIAAVSTRYRCTACGNLTRFDVVERRRTQAYHHYSVSGELQVEEETVLDQVVEDVSCRWCGDGAAVEVTEAV